MIDLQFIRSNPDLVKKVVTVKRVAVDVDILLSLDQQKRGLQTKIDQLNTERNKLAQEAGQSKPSAEVIASGRAMKEELVKLDAQYRIIDEKLQQLWFLVPNIPTADTPEGDDEAGNKVLRQVGKPRTFDFMPKTHFELGETLDVIDTKRAAKVTGSRFTYLKGDLVWVQFGLIQLAMSVVTNRETLQSIIAKANLNLSDTPFIPVIPPVLIKPEVMQQMARLEPREERYHTAADDLYLIGSAEHTLGPIHMSETLDESKLPIRYVGYSPAFRREAGSYGKDVRGILRVHQFDKVEMETFSVKEKSLGEQELLVAIQEYLMQLLGLPYQVVLVCTGDMGKPDARQVDIETWMPGENRYRETHSADLMTDYQARRLQTRVKKQDGATEYVHMNDATTFAIGRTIIAIMENYQEADGSITMPEALHPYLPFKAITAK